MKIKAYTRSTYILLFILLYALSHLLAPVRMFAQCPGLGSATLNVVAASTPTLSFSPQICIGETASIAVNQVFNSYNWSTGDATQSISVSGPGTYTVTVSNATGCTKTVQAVITQASNLNVNITQSAFNCNAQAFTLSATPGFATYAWSSGENTSSILATSSVTYTVTVSNAAGCTGTKSIAVNIPPGPIVTITGSNNICTTTSNALMATPGFVNYAWSGGTGVGLERVVSTAGTYTVTVTNAAGCTGTASITITLQPSPVPTIDGPGQLCAGNPVTLTVDNGPFLSYTWSSGAGSSPSIMVSTGGTYTVTVTDLYGCSGTAVETLTAVTAPTVNITTGAYNCATQSYTLNAGPGFTTYEWSTGDNGQTVAVSASGAYTVTVSNAAHCTKSAQVNITIPVQPVVAITGNLIFCAGSNTMLSATPGFTSYVWSGGTGAGPNRTITTAGTYTVTVSNAQGCTGTSSVAVATSPAPTPDVDGPGQICSGNAATLSVINGPFNTYSWSNATNGSSISVSNSGTYTVTVTDATGCTGKSSETLTVNLTPNVIVSITNYACNGSRKLNATPGFASYVWSNGSTGSSITVQTENEYTVTVTSAQGCTNTASIFADIPPAPTAAISGVASICQGESATLTASPGFNNYLWSNAQTTNAISVFQTGTYFVTVTDLFGCTATANQSVTSHALPQPQISGPTSICLGGSATFSVPGTFTTYAWSNGTSNPTITVGTPSSYTVSVTNAYGCEGTDDIVLSISNSLAISISQQPYTCNGQITLDAGAGFTSYNWSSGSTTATLTVGQNNTYSVTVSDATGCTGVATLAVTIPTAATVQVAGPASICQGNTATLTATPGFNQYAWSNAQVNPAIDVTAGGSYTVTATDANGCTTSGTFALTINALPQPQITGATTICNGGAISLAASSGFAGYAWSSSETTAGINTNTPATYLVTVTDALGCTGTAATTLTAATGLTPVIAAQPYACNSTLTLDAGAGFSTYTWSNGATGASTNVSTNATFSVTVTDTNGCSGTANLAVQIPVQPTVAITGVPTICSGASATLTATAGFATYAWSNGGDTLSTSVNQGATYTITATDANGCTSSSTFALTINPLPQPQITGSNTICNGGTVNLTAGTGFTSYIWSSSETTAGISTSTPATYLVTVTDALGCTGTTSTTLTAATSLSPVIAAQPYACNSTLTLDAGAGFSTYTWSNGTTGSSTSVATNGTFSVTVTDVNGCSGTANLAVQIPAQPAVAIAGTPAICNGASTTLTATAGFSSYIWPGGDNTASISANQAINYTVTATDANGCTSSGVFALTINSLPQPQITGSNIICSGSTVNLTASSGFANYAWSSSESTAGISTSTPATYLVTVTDAIGCTGTASATLTAAASLTPVIAVQPYACNNTLTLNAGTGFSTYTWSNGTTGSSISVAANGTFSVTVTDVNGCSGTANLAVQIPAQPAVAITGTPAICSGASTTLTATAGFTSYIWSGGDNTASISANQAINYTVTATDANGCTSSSVFALTINPLPQPQITGSSIICSGSTVNLTASSGFANYAWSSSQTTAGISTSTPATYLVTVTDASGCTGTASTTLTAAASLTPVIAAQPYACNNTLTLNAGTGFATYAWSNGTGNASTSVAANGTYSVTVTDGNGCSATANLAVQIPAQPAVAITGTSAICSGASTTLTATAGFTSYAWSGGANTASISANQAINYSVTATDANGCTSSGIFALTINPLPQPQITGVTAICMGGNTTLSVANAAAYTGFNWSAGGSAATSISVNAAGTYLVTVTDAAGCTGTASSTTILSNLLTPSITETPYQCNHQLVLNTTAGFANYAWNTGGSSAAITVAADGSYSVTVSDANGCTGTASLFVSIPDSLFVIVQSPSTPICPGGTASLSVIPGLSTYQWNTGNNSNSITVGQAGNYSVTATDQFGCTATDEYAFVFAPNPQVAITGLTTPCDGATTSLTANGNNLTGFSWSTGSAGSSVNNLLPGTYTLTVTDANGCTGTAQATVSAQNPVSFTGTTVANCNATNTITVTGSFTGYQWSNGATTTSITVADEDAYSVTVTNAPGCTGTAVFTPEIVDVLEVALDGGTVINCDTTTVTIAANPVSGGDNLTKYKWSSGATTAQTTFTAAGNYTVTVTNALGCTEVATLTITQENRLTTFADTIEFKPGQVIPLAPPIGFTPASIQWTQPGLLSCPNCLTPEARPVNNVVVAYKAESGPCKAEGFYYLFKRNDFNVYVPNAIYPGSTDNYAFTLYGNDLLLNINYLRVYTRWGELMQELFDLEPGNINAGWDGTFRGKTVVPGVYVFVAEVLFADGTTQVISGDVTVIQ